MNPSAHPHSWPPSDSAPAIAVLGGSGRFGRPYIQEFLDQGLTVKILARSPRKVAQRFPRAQVLPGNMLNLSAVTRIFKGAAAAFLITPTGGNDDVRLELKAARTALKAATITHLPHLIYLSLVQSARPTGVPMLDVKGQIESLARASGVPFSSLRTGCYMDTWLTFFPLCMRLGLYLLPISPDQRFSFTSQRDVARLATLLIHQNTVLNTAVDVVEARARSLQEVINLFQRATGRHLKPMGRWLLPVLKVLKPTVFRWLYPTSASRISLFSYFNKHDWMGDPLQLADRFPGFQVTSMPAHLCFTFPASAHGNPKRT